MKSLQNRFKTVFIDADDTLWENEKYFRNAEARFAALLSPNTPLEDIQHILWDKQEENIPLFGYGSKTYLISMTDAAIDLCGGHLSKELYSSIRQIILDLAFHGVEVFDGVQETLESLSKRYRLILATKGDAVEQRKKVSESGLEKYFSAVEVMKSKDEPDYLELCHKYDIKSEDFLMVGNSVRSDIVPVINIGGTAILIPREIVWVHELAELPESERLVKCDIFSGLNVIL